MMMCKRCERIKFDFQFNHYTNLVWVELSKVCNKCTKELGREAARNYKPKKQS